MPPTLIVSWSLRRAGLARRRGGVIFSLLLAGWLTLTAAAHGADEVAVTPDRPVMLFDGRDLGAFYRWLPATGRDDPDRVFSVVDNVDGAPALRISGQHDGGLVTLRSYANYRLVAEYRWGLLTWGVRKNRARDAGILLHGRGEDGNYAKNFRSPWISSVEFQIIEGGTGDILLLNGFVRDSADLIIPRLTVRTRGEALVWDPAGTPREVENVRVDWRHRDPAWRNQLGFRGAADADRPPGEWNRIVAVCDGGDVSFFVNGVLVNQGTQGTAASGRILFQSEGAEIYFRRIVLEPLRGGDPSSR